MVNKSNANSSINLYLPDTTNSSLHADKHNSTCKQPEQLQSWLNVEAAINMMGMPNNADNEEGTEKEQVAENFYLHRFSEVIPLISQITESGFVCFMNPDSFELEQVSCEMLDNPEAFYAASGGLIEKKRINHLSWHNYYMFEPIPEKELIRLIEDFMQHLTGHRIHNKLARLMMKKKPYAKLDAVINKSKHSNFWMEYKKQYIEKRVKNKLVLLINN